MSEQTSTSRYSLGSVPNMLRSLAVVLGIVVVIIFMVPRVSSVSRPPVDVHSSAVDVAGSTGWPILEPRGLPTGWTPTAVRFVRSTDGLQTWHVGFESPNGDYVALEQTRNATSGWLGAETNHAPVVGTTTVAGRTWTKYQRDIKVQNSLVAGPTGTDQLTTIVTGTGSFDELAYFAEHLAPVAAAAGSSAPSPSPSAS